MRENAGRGARPGTTERPKIDENRPAHQWSRRQTALFRGSLTTNERERLKSLEREVRELRPANEILRKASAYFAQAELDR
jgi:transposase-like protein